jgi:hypothetical protein
MGWKWCWKSECIVDTQNIEARQYQSVAGVTKAVGIVYYYSLITLRTFGNQFVYLLISMSYAELIVLFLSIPLCLCLKQSYH